MSEAYYLKNKIKRVIVEANNSVAMSKDEACSLAMALACGSIPSMVLKSVIELDILEIIKRAGPKAQLSSNEIAAQLPSKNPSAGLMLDRMLRMLANHKVFSFSVRSLTGGRVERLYGLAPVCEFFTKDEGGHTLDKMCLLNQDKITMEVWDHLKDAILDGGIAMERVLGKTTYEYQGVDERYNKMFQSAMDGHSNVVMKKLFETYKGFEGITTLLDLGGGTGTTLNKVIKKYPTIKGINFDLPCVVKDAPSYQGVEHVGGDIFVKVPKADAILMKWTLACWEDDNCLKILKTCYDSLPEHGKVIVWEYNVPMDAESTNDDKKTVFYFDMLRLSSEEGRERTEDEYRTLAKLAGFKGFKTVCSTYEFMVMEFYKN